MLHFLSCDQAQKDVECSPRISVVLHPIHDPRKGLKGPSTAELGFGGWGVVVTMVAMVVVVVGGNLSSGTKLPKHDTLPRRESSEFKPSQL